MAERGLVIDQEAKEVSQEDLEYLGGAFDRGSNINFKGLGVPRNYPLRVRITRADPTKLMPFVPLFNSEIVLSGERSYIEANGFNALKVLLHLKPHVRLFKPTVDFVVDFQNPLKGEQFRQKFLQVRSQMSEVDIGPEPLSLPYVAGFFEQRHPDSDNLRVFLSSGNKSLVFKLREQFGGHISPRDLEIGFMRGKRWMRWYLDSKRETDDFLGRISPYFKVF